MNRTEQTLKRYSSALQELEASFIENTVELKLYEFFTERKTDARISAFLIESKILVRTAKSAYRLESPEKLREVIEDPTIVYLGIRSKHQPISPVAKVSFIRRVINFFFR